MPGAILHRFTKDEYYRMAENGALAPDVRVELLNGQIIDRFPIGPFHGSTIYWLTDALIKASANRWQTFSQSGLDLGEYYEFQPDLMLLRPRLDRYREHLPTARDVFLVIEVSDSSLLLDRTEKLPAYALSGIPEVWIVNVPNKVLEVYREPTGTKYAEHSSVRPGSLSAPQAFPDVQLSISEMLGFE